MQLNGLNSLGLAPLPKQTAKASSEKGANKSSFEDVLDKTGPEIKGETPSVDPREQKAPPQKTAQGQSQNQSQPEAQAMPGQPTAPVLNGPINERILTGAPVTEPTMLNPLGKVSNSLPQDEGVDSLTRRVVWNDFLRKMKDDLGVSAEDVLSAFASLSEEELAQPPQATVDKVVAALGLNDQQAQMAKTYFTELVSKTQARSMGEELKTSNRQINLTLMSQREAQRKTLSHSLDQMNKNFFMKNPQVAAQIQNPQDLPPREEQEIRPMAAALPPMEMIEVPAPAATLPAETVKAPTTALEAMTSAPAPKPEKAKLTEKNTVDELIRQFMMPQAKVESVAPMMAAPVSAAPTAPAASGAAAANAGAAVSAGSLKGLLEDLSASLDSEEDSEYTSDASFLTAGIGGEQKMAAVNGPSAEFQAELTKVTKEPMAVADLVDKAQIMVHEGGGEMKVTLSPDGLGEVAMRVSVNEGKVQVQMITESDEAKRLIERQLGELKSQLHTNNLQLDTIKIDTATNMGKQMEQQYQDAQRQATQTAMEQFRQDNQGWRRSFFEVPSAKLYKGQGEAPRDMQAPVSPASRKAANRRLDLVA